MQRRRVAVLLASAVIGGATVLLANPAEGQEPCAPSHIDWVAGVFERMATIKPGMTRKTLHNVFGTEGGLSTGLQRTYVSRDCLYFKVDVEFQAVGRPSKDEDGRVTLVEGDDDIIVKISPPYLGLSIND
jgi:hypothetical protein